MIGKLTGKIDSFLDNGLVLDVQGVGYLIQASRKTLGGIGQKGEVASLLIETQVREDAITLFGFAVAAEKQWFNLLTSVQGVGAKAGLAILNVCPPDKLSIAIAAQDKAALTQADGVGPKLATRILTELKDKAGKLDMSVGAPVSYNAIAKEEPSESAPELDQDAVSALINLGYGRSDAYAAVLKARQKANDNKTDLQSVIRLALKELSA